MGKLSGIGRVEDPESQVEFFGFQLRVHSPQLAALLNGDEDSVQVLNEAPAGAPPEVVPAVEADDSWRSAVERTSGVVIQLRRPLSEI